MSKVVYMYMHQDISCSVTDVECLPSPDIPNAQKDSNSIKWRSVITYTCEVNTKFSNGLTHKSTECLHTGQWQEIPDDCQGITLN